MSKLDAGVVQIQPGEVRLTSMVDRVLVTDLRLRGADKGLDTIRMVRKLIPNLPSLIITGDSAPERMLESRAMGITVIHKPVSSTRLLAEIGKLTTASDG